MWIISIWHKMTPNDLHFLNALSVLGGTGIHGPPCTGTDRSESIFKILSVLVRSDIWKSFLFLVRFGPTVRKFSWSWSGPVQVLKLLFVLVQSEIPGFGPGPIGFGRWIREGNASNWYGWVQTLFRKSLKFSNFEKNRCILIVFQI